MVGANVPNDTASDLTFIKALPSQSLTGEELTSGVPEDQNQITLLEEKLKTQMTARQTAEEQLVLMESECQIAKYWGTFFF